MPPYYGTLAAVAVAAAVAVEEAVAAVAASSSTLSPLAIKTTDVQSISSEQQQAVHNSTKALEELQSQLSKLNKQIQNNPSLSSNSNIQEQLEDLRTQIILATKKLNSAKQVLSQIHPLQLKKSAISNANALAILNNSIQSLQHANNSISATNEEAKKLQQKLNTQKLLYNSSLAASTSSAAASAVSTLLSTKSVKKLPNQLNESDGKQEYSSLSSSLPSPLFSPSISAPFSSSSSPIGATLNSSLGYCTFVLSNK
jgi:predicted  nucleic acid-binding Zn-ribbon protein